MAAYDWIEVALIRPTQTVRRVLLVLIALGGAVVLPGCLIEEPQVDPTKLAALKKEPIANIKLPGGKLFSQLALDQSSGGLLGATMAELNRVFVFPDPERARQGRAAAIRAAQSSGWKLALVREDPDELHVEGREAPVFGGKKLVTGDATLIIGAYRADTDGRPYVSIRLEHQKCGRGLCSGIGVRRLPSVTSASTSERSTSVRPPSLHRVSFPALRRSWTRCGLATDVTGARVGCCPVRCPQRK